MGWTNSRSSWNLWRAKSDQQACCYLQGFVLLHSAQHFARTSIEPVDFETLCWQQEGLTVVPSSAQPQSPDSFPYSLSSLGVHEPASQAQEFWHLAAWIQGTEQATICDAQRPSLGDHFRSFDAISHGHQVHETAPFQRPWLHTGKTGCNSMLSLLGALSQLKTGSTTF